MHNAVNILHGLRPTHPRPALSHPAFRLLVKRPTLVERPTLVADRGTGYELPDADAYARRLAEEAEAWLAHARARSRMGDETLVLKALTALAFSFRHRAHDFAVPSKLAGMSKHQPVLWQMVKDHVGFGTPLEVEEVPTDNSSDNRSRLVVSYEGEELGAVQPKHVPWLRPLIPFGAGIYLVRVTGQERDFTLGCNVAFGRVGGAVAALNHALGTDLGHDLGSDGDGGDGASQTPTGAALVEAQPRPDHGGDGAAGGLRLISSALPVAKPQAASTAHPDDVVLYRALDGTARATVKHVVRHSPSGIEWGYHGSGPADLARSVLLAHTDEATADRIYQAFKAAVVALVPKSGGVIRAADVRAWLAAHGGDAQR
ncbi:MAG: DUF6166 domain-containing protein [Rhodothermales bacterium]